MGLLSGIIGAFGAVKAGKAAKKQSKINAKQIRKRADIETLVAERSAIKGLGGIRADVGAAGLALAGSAADIIREGERDSAFQLETIREESEFQAKSVLAGGKAAQTASRFAAAGAVIGGAESTASAVAGAFGVGG